MASKPPRYFPTDWNFTYQRQNSFPSYNLASMVEEYGLNDTSFSPFPENANAQVPMLMEQDEYHPNFVNLTVPNTVPMTESQNTTQYSLVAAVSTPQQEQFPDFSGSTKPQSTDLDWNKQLNEIQQVLCSRDPYDCSLFELIEKINYWIRYQEKLHCGKGHTKPKQDAKKKGTCKAKASKPKKSKASGRVDTPESTSFEKTEEELSVVQFLKKCHDELTERLNDIDIRLRTLVNNLKQACSCLTTLEQHLNTLRKIAVVFEYPPGPIFEMKTDQKDQVQYAKGSCQIRFLGGTELWPQNEFAVFDEVQLHVLDESSAQIMRYDKQKSDMTPLFNNSVLVNSNCRDNGELYTIEGLLLTATSKYIPGKTSTHMTNENNSNQFIIAIVANFDMNLLRKKEEEKSFYVSFLNYYAFVTLTGRNMPESLKKEWFMSLPFLLVSHPMKEVVRGYGNRNLTETIIFCGVPDLQNNRKLQLPPYPYGGDGDNERQQDSPINAGSPVVAQDKGSLNDSVNTIMRNRRKLNTQEILPEEIVEFLQHVFILIVVPKRRLNSMCKKFLLQRVQSVNENLLGGKITWKEFSGVNGMDDVKDSFSIGDWFWGNIRLLRESKIISVKKLWDEGLFVGFCLKEDTDKNLQESSCCIKFSNSVMPKKPIVIVAFKYGGKVRYIHAPITDIVKGLRNLNLNSENVNVKKELELLSKVESIYGFDKTNKEFTYHKMETFLQLTKPDDEEGFGQNMKTGRFFHGHQSQNRVKGAITHIFNDIVFFYA